MWCANFLMLGEMGASVVFFFALLNTIGEGGTYPLLFAGLYLSTWGALLKGPSAVL